MHQLTGNNGFVMEGFQRLSPFSSFLPGIAEKNGIPLWAERIYPDPKLSAHQHMTFEINLLQK